MKTKPFNYYLRSTDNGQENQLQSTSNDTVVIQQSVPTLQEEIHAALLDQQVHPTTVQQDQTEKQVHPPTVQQDQTEQQVHPPTVQQDQTEQQVYPPTVQQDQIEQQVHPPTVQQGKIEQQENPSSVQQHQTDQQVDRTGSAEQQIHLLLINRILPQNNRWILLLCNRIHTISNL